MATHSTCTHVSLINVNSPFSHPTIKHFLSGPRQPHQLGRIVQITLRATSSSPRVLTNSLVLILRETTHPYVLGTRYEEGWKQPQSLRVPPHPPGEPEPCCFCCPSAPANPDDRQVPRKSCPISLSLPAGLYPETGADCVLLHLPGDLPDRAHSHHSL